MTINTGSLFPVSFNQDFRDILNHKYTEYIESGGRGSCKSSFISCVIPILMLQNKNYNALILRKVSNTLRDSVYSQIKWALDKLGLMSEVICTTSPLQITFKRTGQTIFFRGADDPLKIKSIKAPSGYIAITWFEEWAEFAPADTTTIKLSSMRGGDKYWIFYSYNPPSSARNWVNNEVRRNTQNRLIHQSSYLTVPPSWLGDAFLIEAGQMKQNNERAYRNVFLGEPTGTGSNIFENIELRTITDAEINTLDFIYEGLDFGYYPDPLRWVRMAYNSSKKILYILDEFTLYKAGNYDACVRLNEYRQKKSYYMQQRITADSAEMKSIADFKNYGFNIRGAVKGPGSINNGFKWLQSLKKIVIDTNRTPQTADEFSLYEYERDKRTGDILSGYPDGQADHSLACCRYAMEEVWRRKGN